MSEYFTNSTTDTRMIQADKTLSSAIEKLLSSYLNKDLSFTPSGPHTFNYKEVKALFPGEILLCTLVCTDGGQGKIRFALSKESAGAIGDILNMGDGSAEFSQEQHLEPLRDLFKEIVSSFKGDISKEIGSPLAFDDIKIVVMDLTPNDFAGEPWTVSSFDVKSEDLEHRIVTIISNEFYDSVFPHEAAAISLDDDNDNRLDPSRLSSSLSEDIGLVMDIELPISIELGRTKMLIRDIVKLSSGSVVELNKLSGEPVDLYVNNKRFARGEVVVVDENFAVRITELSSPAERLAVSQN